jgi:hypothetical protein
MKNRTPMDAARWGWPFCVAVALVVTLPGAGCIQAHVAVVDRATALEQQAGGEFGTLERDLLQSGLSPRAAELTRGEIEASGIDTSRTTLDRILRIHALRAEDDAALDDLFARHCVGEGRDGLVVETADACRGEYDAAAATPLIERANRDRRQLWAYLLELRPNDTPEGIRGAWRKAHRVIAPCGVRWQADDLSWEVKSCDD